jgi:dipeptidyl aminopeptidase/acylaminoacyl peptidase
VTKTDRFKAAVAGAGLSDLGAMVACDIPGAIRSYFGAWPWDDPQVFVEHSALYHAGNVKTPTAFVHGGADDRVPPAQAFELWTALKTRGVPTDLLVLPREPHGPREPRHQRAVMQFQWDWLTRWTLNPPAAAPAAAPPKSSPTGGTK